jgi:hypothetical protein
VEKGETFPLPGIELRFRSHLARNLVATVTGTSRLQIKHSDMVQLLFLHFHGSYI